MIRVPVILAAAAALVLPAVHYIDDALGTGARQLGASVALAAPGVATDKPRPKPPLHRLVHRDRVAVDEDGNGVQAASFATTVAGKNVRYALLIENGCASSDPARPCPAPVTGLTVTLNSDVVFQNDDAFTKARREITLNTVEGHDNTLVLAAKGAPGSAARVRILAIRQPDKPRPKPPLHRLVHRDRVAVDEDGNGVQAASFATTVAGKNVRYALLIENGCASSDPARPCPAPVTGLTVTLNSDVVFQNDDAFTKARREITLNTVEGHDNTLVLAAKGAPGSAARVRILAIRQPDKPRPKPPLHRLVHRDRVAVDEDGNGVQAASFATTVAGKNVRYALLIENGCASSDPARPCPAPVTGLTVTLNSDVVFQNDDAFTKARREITLNTVEGHDNTLVLAAKGAPGSAARVRILAIRQPDKPRPKPPLHRLVHRDRVAVDEDGNGVQAASFATTVAGKNVRYALLIENGCASSDPARPCPAPVTGLTVTLNSDVVFQNDDAFTKARREITLNTVEGHDNTLVLAAKGAPGSAARVRILAIRVAPPDQA